MKIEAQFKGMAIKAVQIGEGEIIPDGVSYCFGTHNGKEVMSVYLKHGGRCMRAYFDEDGAASMGLWYQGNEHPISRTKFDFSFKEDGSLVPMDY